MNFTVTVKNNGPDTASGVKITDLLPDGLKLLSYTVSQGTYNSITGIWDIGNLNVNGTSVLTLVVQALQNGNITNVANKT